MRSLYRKRERGEGRKRKRGREEKEEGKDMKVLKTVAIGSDHLDFENKRQC